MRQQQLCHARLPRRGDGACERGQRIRRQFRQRIPAERRCEPRRGRRRQGPARHATAAQATQPHLGVETRDIIDQQGRLAGERAEYEGQQNQRRFGGMRGKGLGERGERVHIHAMGDAEFDGEEQALGIETPLDPGCQQRGNGLHAAGAKIDVDRQRDGTVVGLAQRSTAPGIERFQGAFEVLVCDLQARQAQQLRGARLAGGM